MWQHLGQFLWLSEDTRCWLEAPTAGWQSVCSYTLSCDQWLESKHCTTSWTVSEEHVDRENQRQTADVMLVYTHPVLRNALPCIASPMCTAGGALSGSALLRPWRPYDTIPLHLPHHLTCQGQSDSKVLESLMSVKGCGIDVSLMEHLMNGNQANCFSFERQLFDS